MSVGREQSGSDEKPKQGVLNRRAHEEGATFGWLYPRCRNVVATGGPVRSAALQRRAQCEEGGGIADQIEGLDGDRAVERALAAGVWLV